MVHAFTLDGKYFLFDVESGSLIECDEIAYNIVLSDKLQNAGQTNFLLSKYSKAQIDAARKEMEILKKEGLLFTAEVRHQIAKNTGIIKAICLHVCHDCNLACGYCFASQGVYNGPKGMMSLDTAKKAVDFLLDNSGTRKNLEIDFFGGEPLMNFAVVKETVEYAKKRAEQCGKEFKFTMTTNALLLNREAIDFLDREMDNVVISIDGRKEVHDKVRPASGGKGSHDIVLKNALAFAKVRKQSGKDYYIRGTYTADNLDFAADVNYLVEQGFDRISVEPVVLPFDNPLALKEEHAEKLCNEYERLAKDYTGYTFFHFMIDLKNSPCLYKRLRACGAGCEYVALTPEGDIFPCHQFVGNKKFLMGNISEGRLDSSIQKMFSSITVYDKPDCKDCFAKYHCSGGCFANSYNYKGDFLSHERLGCLLMRKRLECALFLYSKSHNSFD